MADGFSYDSAWGQLAALQPRPHPDPPKPHSSAATNPPSRPPAPVPQGPSLPQAGQNAADLEEVVETASPSCSVPESSLTCMSDFGHRISLDVEQRLLGLVGSEDAGSMPDQVKAAGDYLCLLARSLGAVSGHGCPCCA